MQRRQGRNILRRGLSFSAGVVVLLYVILDAVLVPVFRPLARWLSQRLLWIDRAVSTLPAYGILAMLIVPFAVAEPAKLYAVYLMGSGQFLAGLIMLVAAYVISILIVERIFRAGREKLMAIWWFARGFAWVTAVRDRIVAWIKLTAAWTFATEMKKRIHAAASHWLARRRRV